MDNLIEVRGLAKHYEGFALEGIDLTVPAGAVVGLVGGNGAGKTTTIKAILGMIAPDAGSVSLMGVDSARASEREMACARGRVGAVFDSCAFPDDVSAAQAGRVMSCCYPKWDAELFARLLAEAGIAPDKRVKDLSRGMGMRLSLATALAHRPAVLVLDEATAGLDPLARDEALDALRAFMAEGEDRGILMSSHITSDLEKIADYIVCIDGGRVRFSCEMGVITEKAGVVRCAAADMERIAESGLFAPGELRVMRMPFGVSVLVPDRFAFARRFGDMLVEPCDVEAYMGFMLKGERK